MWRDEMHVFLICHNSHSLQELIFNLRYDGHTWLWYCLVYFVTCFSDSPLAMQLLHLFFAGCSAFIFLFHSPFIRLQKYGLAFSYYFLYEYTVISRDYALAVLSILLFCLAYFSTSKHRLVLCCVCLFFLAQTGVYGLILAGSFTFLLLSALKKKSLLSTRFLSCFILIVAGIIISILQMMPPDDAGLVRGWHTSFDPKLLGQSIEIIYKSIFVLPQPQLSFWNSNFMDACSNGTFIKIVLSIITLASCILIFRHNKGLLFSFLLATTGIVIFSYIKYYGYQRHHGHIYLCFLACYWIHLKKEKGVNHESFLTSNGSSLNIHLQAGSKKFSILFFFAVLICQLLASFIAVYFDLKYNFSGGKSTALFLKEKKLENAFISADTDYVGTAVSGYLNRSIFYPQSGRTGTFIIFDQARERYLKYNEVYSITQEKIKSANMKRPILYLLNYPVNDNNLPVHLIFKSGKTIVPDEECFIYEQDLIGK